MNPQTFFARFGLKENPFDAEEARHDEVFERVCSAETAHPDFAKIMGRAGHPSTAVVFGEKGSGKTAIRLMISKEIARHNEQSPNRRVLLVAYDEMNPFLSRFAAAQGATGDHDVERVLGQLRQQDHQDAVLSLVTTRVVDALLGENGASTPEAERVSLSEEQIKRLRMRPRRNRVELALLAALYDQPALGSALERWPTLMKTLRLRRAEKRGVLGLLAVSAAGVATALGLALWFGAGEGLGPILGLVGAVAAFVWSGRGWLSDWLRLRRRSRAVSAGCAMVWRPPGAMETMLGSLRAEDISDEALPTAAASNARYDWTRRVLEWLEWLGYHGMVVLVDRVDEPTIVRSEPKRMKAIVWPLLDNKLLQQPGVGFKLLLPLELRREVLREDPDFFQHARLDKQHLVDRLEWSGATLYGVCNARLRACAADPNTPITLRALFADDVSAEVLVAALDQMKQPRDAFKFVYDVVKQHCDSRHEEEGESLIPRATLDLVLRQHVHRVSDMQRGYGPG